MNQVLTESTNSNAAIVSVNPNRDLIGAVEAEVAEAAAVLNERCIKETGNVQVAEAVSLNSRLNRVRTESIDSNAEIVSVKDKINPALPNGGAGFCLAYLNVDNLY